MIDKFLKNNNFWQCVNSMIIAFAVCIAFSMSTANPLYLLVGGLYWSVSNQKTELEKREKRVAFLLGGLFSLFTVWANIENVLAVNFLPWPLTMLVCIYGFYLGYYYLLGKCLFSLRNIGTVVLDGKDSSKQAIIVFGASLVSLLIIWGIGLLVSYPGNTTRDSNTTIYTALGMTEMRADIPIVYVLAIRFFWHIGENLFGTPNACMAVCSIAHIIPMVLIISYLLARLCVHGIKKSVCIIIWMFYAFIPYNVQLSHTLWKDVPFSAFVFLFMVLLWELFEEKVIISKGGEYIRLLLLVISGVGMCLMRNNGFFAYLLCISFACLFFIKKNKKVVGTLLLTFVIVRIIQGPVYDKLITENRAWINRMEMATNEEESNKTQEKKVKKDVKNATDSYNSSAIYIMTSQQLARVAVDRFDLSTEDYLRLDKLINVEEMRQEYDPHCSDSAIKLLRFKVGSSKYLKEWLYFGVKYPIQYILAYKDQTYGYWYPDVQYWVYTDQIKENNIGMYKHSILSEDVRYEWLKAEELYKEIPIYGMLWSIGFIVWVTLFFAGLAYVKKGFKSLLVYLPVIGVWGTLLVATPVYAEFRYIYAMFLCLPLSVFFPFLGEKVVIDEEEKDEVSICS